MFLNGEKTDDAAINRYIRGELPKNPELQAIIAADKVVPHGTVVRDDRPGEAGWRAPLRHQRGVTGRAGGDARRRPHRRPRRRRRRHRPQGEGGERRRPVVPSMAAKFASGTAGPFSTALLASVLLHVGLVIALARAPREQATPRRPETLELQVLEPPPPPTPAAPGRAGAAPAAQAGGRAPPAQAAGGDRPPPPNRTPPPEPQRPIDEPPTPVFGVTERLGGRRGQPGGGAGGQHRDGEARDPPPDHAPGGPARGGDAVCPGGGHLHRSSSPALLREEKVPMPENAVRMGIGGQVVMRVGVDREGKVRSVRVHTTRRAWLRRGGQQGDVEVQVLPVHRHTGANGRLPADLPVQVRGPELRVPRPLPSA